MTAAETDSRLARLPRPFNRTDAAEVGLTRRALDEARALGRVDRVRQGWYVVRQPPAYPGQEPWAATREDHLDRVRQQLRRLPGHVASHSSGALLHDLGVMISPSSPVELTSVDRAQRSWQEEGLVVHHSDSSDIPVVVVDGLRVTSEARTVADTLRTRRLPHGTALVDEVLREGRMEEHELLRTLAGQKRWRGRPRALVAVELSDPRRESWLESYSDVALYEWGVPLPLPQVNIFDDELCLVARVDGLDPEHGIFREADGEGKYFLDMGPTTTPEQAVRARLRQEETRQARLEALGLRGVRWTSSQIMDDPQAVADQVMALRRAPVPTIRGYGEWEGELHRFPFHVERPRVDLTKARTRRQRRRSW